MEELFPDDAAVHHETLKLLAEAAEYLGRLPLSHPTLQLKSRLDAHLQRPGAKVHRDRLENIAKDREWRARLEAGQYFHGTSRYTPEGLPVVDCLVIRGNVYLRSPAYADLATQGNSPKATQMAETIAREIATGSNIQLTSVGKERDHLLMRNWQDIPQG
ncbi:hypothetical protein RQP54_18175 [Curvibacter sp. APW13]|uniref:hypothetical protein n=1 Tax=Curvibacter sp. APW13 TaxID=3077236 RepID=UPI0028DF2BAB|nr:hypothetical protein [Curvibacter sp. APW13]MDT8992806.1 hypothetical protein [Curvibacter sp. APW13]